MRDVCCHIYEYVSYNVIGLRLLHHVASPAVVSARELRQKVNRGRALDRQGVSFAGEVLQRANKEKRS